MPITYLKRQESEAILPQAQLSKHTPKKLKLLSVPFSFVT